MGRTADHPQPGPGRRRAAVQLQARVTSQDQPLQLRQVAAGLKPLTVDQVLAGLREDRQRLALPAGPVQRQHQQPPQPFPLRVRGGQQAEFGDHLVLAPEQQRQFEPLLLGGQPQLGQPAAVHRGERPRQPVQSAAPPERERPVQGVGRSGRLARRALGPGPRPSRLELVQVQLAGADREAVARAVRGEHRTRRPRRPLRLQDPPQPRDVGGHQAGRVDGGADAPDGLHDLLPGHRLVGAEQQHRQHRALHGGPRIAGLPGPADQQRPEQLVAEQLTHPGPRDHSSAPLTRGSRPRGGPTVD